jgi:hypothetical protein
MLHVVTFMDSLKKQDILKYNSLTHKGASKDLVLSSIAVARTIQGQPSAELLKVLFDSGGTKTFLNSKCLPRGATPSVLKNPLQGITTAGQLTANTLCYCKISCYPNLVGLKKLMISGPTFLTRTHIMISFKVVIFY